MNEYDHTVYRTIDVGVLKGKLGPFWWEGRTKIDHDLSKIRSHRKLIIDNSFTAFCSFIDPSISISEILTLRIEVEISLSNLLTVWLWLLSEASRSKYEFEMPFVIRVVIELLEAYLSSASSFHLPRNLCFFFSLPFHGNCLDQKGKRFYSNTTSMTGTGPSKTEFDAPNGRNDKTNQI